MMGGIRALGLGLVVAIGLSRPVAAARTPEGAAAAGTPAPSFSGEDLDGQPWSLAALRGRYVVLEWLNPDCPFSKKHYTSGNMQQLQRRYTGRGVVWLSVDSSAPGKQGHLVPAQARAFVTSRDAAPTALLLDPSGAIGRSYGATTTPHLFIIDPAGVVIYRGAIDDRPSADPADVPGATNYVAQALEEALSGRPVSVSDTRPYGCSVKYAP